MISLKRLWWTLLLLAALPLSAQITNNDSSCDISVTPAATLLLPHFEVDFSEPPATARTTIFTVVNTSALPQIARATIWTDWGFPVLTFDLFLTGYDAASVNLYDVLAYGRIAPSGTARPGPLSAPNFANRSHAPTAVFDCNERPAAVPPEMLSALGHVLTTGRLISGACGPFGTDLSRRLVGGNHGLAAVGYMTIDVVATCSSTLPTDSRYFESELLYDNVLTGDWMTVSPGRAGNYANASPLVHIRAVPEGGPAGTVVPSPLPYTFYGRMLSNRPVSERTVDRRQPLPSVFAVRFIEGGTADFQTRLTVWREAITGPNARCDSYFPNGNLPISDVVRFDEHENASIITGGIQVLPPPGDPGLPVSSMTSSRSVAYPTLFSPHGDNGGWLYLNLGRYRSIEERQTAGAAGQEQAWVTVSMFAEGRYAVAFDAAALQNGCSAPRAAGVQIGPDAER